MNEQKKCEFCGMKTYTRKHHLVPRCKDGEKIADTCPTCEGWIHGKWTHNELRDTFNSVEAILADEGFQKFLKWRRKQPVTALFKSQPSKFRDKNPYH
jgi:5-methylcytosine-specific restriction enzyme A